MYLLYIDESGTTNLKKDNMPSPDGGNTLYFVLGAAFIHARELENIENVLEKLKSEYFKDPHTEIKYSRKAELFKQGKSISDYRETVYKTIKNSNITLFGVHENKFDCWRNNVVVNKDDTYQIAFEHLVSIINGYMIKNKIKEPITVFIDSVDPAHDLKIYNAYKQALKNDALYPNFDKSIFSPSLNFAVSQFTVGLQIADMVAGSLWKAMESGDKTYSTLLKEKFPSSDNGNPIGYGYTICQKWLTKK